MVKIFDIGRAGGCCSNREPPDQIERVGMFDFENVIHRSFVDIFSLTVLLLVILFFSLSASVHNSKTTKDSMYSTKSYILFKIKALLENVTLSARSNTPFAFKIPKLYKQSGKKIALACREIRQKKKLFIEDKRIVCLVCISVCL